MKKKRKIKEAKEIKKVEEAKKADKVKLADETKETEKTKETDEAKGTGKIKAEEKTRQAEETKHIKETKQIKGTSQADEAKEPGEIERSGKTREMRLGAVESRFAQLIWEREPLTTAELVKLCGKELCWKRTTTYTVLKRLSERGLFQNVEGTVRSLISKEEFYSIQSERFVQDTFGGSLPAFLAAFTKRKDLSAEEIDKIREMIDSCGG